LNFFIDWNVSMSQTTAVLSADAVNNLTPSLDLQQKIVLFINILPMHI